MAAAIHALVARVMRDRLRLPFTFDAAALRADVERLQAGDWVRHFVADNYDGDWTVLPLRAPAKATHPVQMIYSDPSCDSYVDTPLLAACPAIAAALATLQCPLTSVRLMRLGAGSVIKTHSDHDLDVEHGRVRLHIPIETNPDVDFRLNDTRVVLGEGECWYLRLSDPHSVANRGARDRVHLVIDAIVSPWLHAHLERAEAKESAADSLQLAVSGSQLAASGSQLPASGREVALPEWIPIHVHADASGASVDWCHAGTASFSEPFFEDTIDRVRRAARTARTPIDVLIAEAEAHPGLAPTAFIFHCSRCGSTLLSQLARAVPGTVVMSEPPPIDDVLRAPWPRERRLEALRAVVAALGQPRSADDRRYVIKFDAWSTLELALVREAFPDVPRVFVYRDPAEVLASQMRMPGRYLVPGELDPAVAGLASVAEATAVGREEYCARVLGRILSAAMADAEAGGLVLLNYRDFPQTAIETVLGWTGREASADDRARLANAATMDAKTPVLPFQPQPASPRTPSAAARDAVLRFADAPFVALEQLRTHR